MMRFAFRSIVTALLTSIVALAAAPVILAVAQTPGPGAASDPCSIVATPPARMPQAGMMMGTPPMGSGDMPGMMDQLDLMFIDMMIPHHASAVAMAQVAQLRAEHPEVRAIADDIIESQSAEIDQMEQWRDQWFPDAPAMPMDETMGMMTDMMGEMMPGEMPGGMMGTPGAMPPMGMMMGMGQEIVRLCATTENFDLAFIDAMIPHHQSAILMAQVALVQAEHPELKSLAQAIIDAQQREIDQMQAWRAAWSGTATAAASPTS